MSDIVERLRKIAEASRRDDGSLIPLGEEITDAADEITLLRAQLATALEDRARFPDKPDMIGNMIGAHYGNLKAKAENAEEHCRRLRLETAVAIQDAKRKSLEQAAGTHQTRVTEIRNDPASYKNGTITKSAKRASDFHERSAQAILALQVGEQ